MSRYREYAAEIRREYISVPRSEYLERRGKFLRHSLTSEHFSATSEFRALDAQARSNIEWEINEFNNSRIPGEL
jgi:predicted metal-dependent HD superfamily phosphohydrolase